jgi:phenylacetic acid degradation operon negative regulatory protein
VDGSNGTNSGGRDDARPGALVADLLGDFNRVGGSEMRLKSLVTLGEELGVSGPTMRVTLARLRERGWFEVRREGRESVYRLTPRCVRALRDGGQRIFHSRPGPWAREWSMVIYTVAESDRQTRDELRKQLAWLGFGPLAPATWICPHPRLDDIANAAATLSAARLTLLMTRTSGPAADRALADRCWELDSLGADYEAFNQAVRARMPDYKHTALDGKTALVERIRLVNDYRRFAHRDPELPEELQPAGWPGDEARRLFEQAHSLLAAPSAEYYARLLAIV